MASLNSAKCFSTTRIGFEYKLNPRGTNQHSGTRAISTVSTAVALGLLLRSYYTRHQLHRKKEWDDWHFSVIIGVKKTFNTFYKEDS
jgi:hypothetical protein